MECLNEFYSTYDDSQLRWNGAELLTRVAGNFSSNDNVYNKNMELRLQPSFLFFPISHDNILRYDFNLPLLLFPHSLHASVLPHNLYQ